MNPVTEALLDIGQIVQRTIERDLGETKLSPAQLRILLYVGRANSLTPSELAALLLQETHSISGLLNRLEDQDLITRTRDRQDRRVVHVGLLPKGEKLLARAEELLTKAEDGLVFPATGIVPAASFLRVRDALLPRVADGAKGMIRNQAREKIAIG